MRVLSTEVKELARIKGVELGFKELIDWQLTNSHIASNNIWIIDYLQIE
jgi:hypothetical protein